MVRLLLSALGVTLTTPTSSSAMQWQSVKGFPFCVLVDGAPVAVDATKAMLPASPAFFESVKVVVIDEGHLLGGMNAMSKIKNFSNTCDCWLANVR